MNRADKRRAERSANKYDQRTTFTKAEVERMNELAYDLGVKHTLEASNLALGIGPARQNRIKDKLQLLQALDFDYFLKRRQ